MIFTRAARYRTKSNDEYSMFVLKHVRAVSSILPIRYVQNSTRLSGLIATALVTSFRVTQAISASVI